MRVQHVEHRHDEVELLGAGLAARHVQIEAGRARFLELRKQRLVQGLQLVAAHLVVACHGTPPPFTVLFAVV